nr:transposase [Armatimonadota bacterium]
DAVRSTAKHVVLSMGIRWLCFCLLVKVPWSRRKWALPILVMPALSEKRAEQLGKQYHSPVDITIQIIRKIRQWLPQEDIALSADGGFAAVELVRTCQSFERPVRFVCRARLDAALYELTGEQPKSKRGPKPKRGKRQPSPQQLLNDSNREWEKTVVDWYGGETKELEIMTGVSLWHSKPPSQKVGKDQESKDKERFRRKGLDPVLIRWVLVRCLSDPHFEEAVYFCSDVNATPLQIFYLYMGRWNIEITFEEIRAQMGFETQRHWSTLAIGRVTPCLFGLFSLVVAMAKTLYPETLPVKQSGWYHKENASFGDALAAVRSHLWSQFNYSRSSKRDDLCLIPRALFQTLQDTVCYVL